MRQKRTHYSPELADAICRRVQAGASFEAIAEEPDMPGLTALYKWRRTLPEFRAQLDAARRSRAEAALGGDLAEARRRGAPETYTPELGRLICELIMQGTSTKALMARRDLPHIQTIRRWLNRHPDFREAYLIAVQVRAEILAEEAMQIADAADGRDGVAKARLQVDIRKWLSGVLSARRTAERYAGEGDRDGSPQSYEEALRELLKRRAGREGPSE
jgi:hypothetical protein